MIEFIGDSNISICAFIMICAAFGLFLTTNDTLKRWLHDGIQDLGEPAVTELLLDWIDPFITRVEKDRLNTWHLGVSLSIFLGDQRSSF